MSSTITWEHFVEAIKSPPIGVNLLTGIPDEEKDGLLKALECPPNESIFIVAGPGSGKTTTLTLKILKLIFVDGVNPDTILVTTFTKKAASELSSRLYEYAHTLFEYIEANAISVKRPNVTSIHVGTLDSICEDLVGEYREPGEGRPTVVEGFAASGIMLQMLFKDGRFRNNDLKNYLQKFSQDTRGLNPQSMVKILFSLKERCFHDLVDIKSYLDKQPDDFKIGANIAFSIIDEYQQRLEDEGLLDFATLEYNFYKKLIDGKLSPFLDNLKFVLVDEYQDTNYLQEKIYLEMAKGAMKNNGSIAVVGDDDQSLYRFRGATVDLFTSFSERANGDIDLETTRVNLNDNYRSTTNIVSFCNDFITLDKSFQDARVPDKLSMNVARDVEINYPIIAIVGEDREEIAEKTTAFIANLCYSHKYNILSSDVMNNYSGDMGESIEIATEEGFSPSDICVLGFSTKEVRSGKERFSRFLRQNLEQNSINVFNPKGEELQNIESIKLLCGLILHCLDSDLSVQNSERLVRPVINVFNDWRKCASRLIHKNPAYNDVYLKDFVFAWANRTPLHSKKWPREVPLIRLVYELISWIPEMRDDIEGIARLELLCRTIEQASTFSSYNVNILKESPYNTKSVSKIIWDVLVPIAAGTIEIEEDLLETLPPNRVNIMTIHRSKGLEFPIVIVDVGTDYTGNYHKQASSRFPSDASEECIKEDEFRDYSLLKVPERETICRTFDDIIRRYFVAYSRPRDLLVLVGTKKVMEGRIKAIACGYTRDEVWCEDFVNKHIVII